MSGAAAPCAGKPARGFRTALANGIAGYLFVAPDAIGLLIFVGGPMMLSLSLGFFSVSGFGEYAFVGLDNYRRMLGDPLFWRSLRVTLLYVVALVPALYVVGLGLALLVQREHPLQTVVRSLLFMPQTVSLVVVGARLAGVARRQDRPLQPVRRRARTRRDLLARRSALCARSPSS